MIKRRAWRIMALCFVLIASLLPMQVLAVSSVNSSKQKREVEKLLEKSTKISNDDTFIDEESGIEYLVEKYKYEEVTSFRNTSVTSIRYTDVITPSRGPGGMYISEWDKSASICFTLHVFYTTSQSGLVPYVKFDGAEGSCVVYDSSVSVKSQSVVFTQYGAYHNSSGNLDIFPYTTVTKYPSISSNGWSYSLSWAKLIANDEKHQTCVWNYTLGRPTGTNTWSGAIGINVPS